MTTATNIIDTIENVKSLINKVKKAIKKAQGESISLWKDFLKECRSFIRAEKKRVQRKWNALRFASEGAANLHEMLQCNNEESREVALTVLEGNWEGYLIWVEKAFRNKDYSNRQYMGGSYWTGKYYEAGYILSYKVIKKLAMSFKKAFYPDAKITIKMEYKEYCVKYKREQDLKAAQVISEFLNEFGFDFSNSMADYFFRGYDSDYYFVGE